MSERTSVRGRSGGAACRSERGRAHAYLCERGFRVRIFSSSHLPFFSSLPSTSKRFHAFGGPFADFTIPHNAVINSESRLLSR